MPDKHPTSWSLVNEEIGDGVLAVDANGEMFDLNTEAARCVAAVTAMETMINPISDLPEIEGRLSFLERVIGEYEKAVKNDGT